jgi:hypothetical protein
MVERPRTPPLTQEQQQEKQANMPMSRARRHRTFNTPPANRDRLRNKVVESPPSESRRWTKLAVRNREKIFDPPKASVANRSNLAPNTIMYATDARWLTAILEGRSDVDSVGDVQRCVKWVGKLVYFLHHRINKQDVQVLLTSCGFADSHHYKFAKMAASLARDQSRYQNDILTNYVYPTVGYLIGEWSHKEGNADRKFEDLESADRRAVWWAHYDKAPMDVCKRFWAPVQAVIDYSLSAFSIVVRIQATFLYHDCFYEILNLGAFCLRKTRR